MYQPATYEDLIKLPEHLLAEIVEGELFASGLPGTLHNRVAGALCSQLWQFDDGAWVILWKPELHLGDDVLVPDLVGWRRERMPTIADVPFIELVPDWICEVVSAKTAAHDRYRKLPRYAAHEIEYAWIVDTLAKGVEVYRRHGAGWYQVAMHHGTRRIRAVPFEAGEINLAALWID